MAIQFTSDFPSTQVLNAFNNNVVSFNSNSGTNALSATISVLGSLGAPSVSVTPNPSGNFSYNFRELFATIVNKNHFRDDIYNTPIGGSYIYQDGNVYKDITVQYTITLEDGNTETTSRSYRVLRSVVQIEDYRRGLTNSGNSSIAILLPFTDNSNKTLRATMFDGYPFDISIYSSTYQNVVFDNKTTDYQLSVALKRGVNRFFFSNGITNVTLNDDLPIAIGENEIEIRPEGDSSELVLQTLYLTKKEACEGHLLKWFNDFGGWCYFLFHQNRETNKSKDIGEFPADHSNIKDTRDAFTSLGYSREKNTELFASYLDQHEKKLINTLFYSPKVYLYLNGTFQLANEKDFVAIKADTNKVEDNFRYFKYVDFFFEIYRPLINTMTM